MDQDLRLGPEADLEDLAPGAGLVAALEDVEPAQLEGEELAAYVRACWRAQNRATSVLLEAVHHLGRADVGRTDRRPGLDEFSGDEVATALGWSRTMAARKLDLADDLQGRLPDVGDALHEGRLDEPKARTFCELTRDLADDHAREVCRVVLPEAPGLPVGALSERIEKVATSLDPEWAERRRRRAEARARVILSPNLSGTATLAFCDAPAPDGINSQARIDALAAAVRHLGVLLPIGVLRLRVGMRLLDGSTAGMDDRTVALLLAAEYAGEQSPDEPGEPGDTAGPDDSDGPDGPGPGGGPDGPTPPDPTPEASPLPDVLDLPDLPAPSEPPSPPVVPTPDRGPGRLRDGTVEVRLRLTTALGLDQLPGSVPGYGTVLAHDARTMIAQRDDGEWRVVLTDPDGHLQHVLLARRRPAGPRHRSGHRVRGRRAGRTTAIVELQVPTTVLAALVPDDHVGWAPLLIELQHRLAELGHAPVRPPEPDDPARRRAGAELDRWIRVRDRHCVAPSCRRPAHRADLDHTVDHARGGPTRAGNLGAWCRHHHRAKHHAGWRVRQPVPGRFEVRTRAGTVVVTTPRKVLEPLPEPYPAVRPRRLPDDGGIDGEDAIDPDWFRKVAPRAARNDVDRVPATNAASRPLSDPGEPPF